VKFKFTKKNSDILPGMYAKISVKIGYKKETVIPYDALTSRGGIVGMGHARAIISLPESMQLDIVQKILDRGWSVRETEQYAQSLIVPKATKGSTNKEKPELKTAWQEKQSRISEKLGAPIKINHRHTGKGKIEIPYGSEEDLATLLDKLQNLKEK
jgi:hypothetical protein